MHVSSPVGALAITDFSLDANKTESQILRIKLKHG
jgi:hypothetical protein